MLIKKLYETNNQGNLVYRDSLGSILIKTNVNNNVVYCDSNNVVVCNYPKPPEGFNTTVVGVTIKRLPVNNTMNFSDRLVDTAISQRWMLKSDTHISIYDKLTNKTHQFKILTLPGRFCLHCNEKLDDDQSGSKARLHIETEHEGLTTSDVNDNSGYVCNNFYSTVWEK